MTNSCNSFSGNVDEEPEMKMNNTWTLFVACFGFCEGDKMLWRTHPTIQVGGKRAKDGRWRESRERYWHLTNGLAWRHFQQTNILSYICNFLHHSPCIHHQFRSIHDHHTCTVKQNQTDSKCKLLKKSWEQSKSLSIVHFAKGTSQHWRVFRERMRSKNSSNRVFSRGNK